MEEGKKVPPKLDFGDARDFLAMPVTNGFLFNVDFLKDGQDPAFKEASLCSMEPAEDFDFAFSEQEGVTVRKIVMPEVFGFFDAEGCIIGISVDVSTIDFKEAPYEG